MTGFTGKVAVVTGAARGIGAAVARALAADGAAVGLVDIASEGLERTADAIAGQGGRAAVVRADVTSEPEVAAAFEHLAADLGGVDMLASFAGVVGYAPAPDCDEREWDRIMGVNAKGPFLCVKHAIPHIRRRGGGAVVLTSSIMAFATEQTAAVYSASKAAVAAMTGAMALDHAGEGIRINCIVPGVIRTELLDDAAALFDTDDPKALVESWGLRHPIARIIEPDEVAQVVRFLLSDAASAVTGSCYRVDGGLLSRLG
ncbi:SDR family NAD(P)-dependent oxidoreductase [Rhizohabitans arisaemae]|uniref:SDR family NAD(P)-dependent oxidoreductase n=1 Tax=Rhizohabitans arisaemae TaxID=2720610 RepID=UPI0024B14394|nr:SDR family NAD(P)-dependent oxidoreductase [Rhizohabitans arisaemae]